MNCHAVSLGTFPSMRTGGRMCTRALTEVLFNDLKLEMISVSFHTKYLRATSQVSPYRRYAK